MQIVFLATAIACPFGFVSQFRRGSPRTRGRLIVPPRGVRHKRRMHSWRLTFPAAGRNVRFVPSWHAAPRRSIRLGGAEPERGEAERQDRVPAGHRDPPGGSRRPGRRARPASRGSGRAARPAAPPPAPARCRWSAPATRPARCRRGRGRSRPPPAPRARRGARARAAARREASARARWRSHAASAASCTRGMGRARRGIGTRRRREGAPATRAAGRAPGAAAGVIAHPPCARESRFRAVVALSSDLCRIVAPKHHGPPRASRAMAGGPETEARRCRRRAAIRSRSAARRCGFAP